MITLPPEEMKRWQGQLQPIVDAWVEENEKAGRPARQLLADIKKLGEKYGPMSSDDLMRLALEQPVMGIK